MAYDIDYLITGGTGLIGSAFIRSLPADARVVVLSRQETPQAATKIGRKVEIIHSLDQIPYASKIRFCLNLSGEPIVDKPWTASRKSSLLESRAGITSQIVSLSSKLPQPFEAFISGSAIGFYPNSLSEAFDETSRQGDSFAATLCKQWESEASVVKADRTCILRTGIVLAKEGGMLKKLRPSFAMGAGASLGSGEQMMSWIHINDAVSIIHFLFERPDATGPINMCTNNPVSNKRFSASLAAAMHRPFLLNIPTFAVSMLFGQRASLMLDSQTIIPKRLLDLGYSFKYHEIEEALSEIYR